MSTIRKRIFFFFATLLAILGTTFFIIKIAKGYKFDFSKKTFRPTGLLVATSIPDGAQVFIDGKLKSATNTTISLSPDTYQVEIKKDGFSSWKKSLKIEKELVVKTDAYLFPQVPDLKALTFTGAINPTLSPDKTKVVYAVSESEGKDGLWVMDLSELPLGISREPRQILKSAPKGRDFSKANFRWSPDSKQILVSLKREKSTENFLIDPNTLNLATELVDVTSNLPTILKQWEKEEKQRTEQKLKKLPPELLEIIQNKTKNISFSPDETKILYTATASATIRDNLITPPPAASSQKQERSLKIGQTYVYDIKEDRNFWVADQEANISWFPTSRHLIQLEKEKITIMEYDGTNKTTVYSGPYEFPFAFAFPAGNKILILTTLSKDLPQNLYAVSLR